MENTLRVLETTKSVIDTARFVKIHQENIPDLANRVQDYIEKNLSSFDASFRYSDDPAINAQRVLVQNAANFCYWDLKDEMKWTIEWPTGKSVGGGFGLWATMDRAIAENVPVLDANYLTNMSLDDIRHIFRPNNGVEIPDIDKRLRAMKEVGSVLLDKFDGQAINIVKLTANDAIKLVKAIADNFSSYNDKAKYNGQTVYFYKRAQICASEINASGNKLENIDQLTAFADYKIPQLLRHNKILEYKEGLANRIANYELIPAGSAEEIEIRATTVWTIEYIRRTLQKYNAMQIDNAIWLLSQNDQDDIEPYHRTKNIFY